MNEPIFHIIRADGKDVLRGDESSVRIVFNNLTGKNRERLTHAWPSHAEYLAYMEAEYGSLVGEKLSLIDGDGKVVASRVIEALDAGSAFAPEEAPGF